MSAPIEQVAGAESTASYEPVVVLKEIETDSGEKDETELYKENCALYRYDAKGLSGGPEWKERGRGAVRLLQHKETKKVRIILREGKTLKVRMNHLVHPLIELVANEGSDRSWTWATTDYSEDTPTPSTFAIKFRNAEVANAFKAKYNESRKINEAALSGAPVPEASVSTSADTKVEEGTWFKIISDRKFDSLTEGDIKKLFDAYDKDKSNSIEVKELEGLFTGLMEAVFAVLREPMTPELQAKIKDEIPSIVATAIKTLDKNQDGKVSWDEFKGLNDISMLTTSA